MHLITKRGAAGRMHWQLALSLLLPGLLLLSTVWAQSPSLRSAQEPPKLCAGRQPATNVLIGRFRGFAGEERSDSNTGLALAYGAYSALVLGQDIVPATLQEGPSALLIEEAFTGGAREADARSRQVAQQLRLQACHFLFGGQITRRGESYVVTPYLLDAESGEISRPFAPIFFERQEILTRVGERL